MFIPSQPLAPLTPSGKTSAATRCPVSRRKVLNTGVRAGAGIATAASLGLLDQLVEAPHRIAQAAPAALPDIQYDLGAFIPPAVALGGIQFRFGPVYTLFLTARLRRTPVLPDQAMLERALRTIEGRYAFSPQGIFTLIAYSTLYFGRLPGGMQGAIVKKYMPRLLSDPSRFALEEAVPAPTDVQDGVAPFLPRPRYNVPVRIEKNHVLLTLRSDSLHNIQDVLHWFQGSNRLHGQTVPSPAFASLFSFTSARLMFVQVG